MFSIEGGDFNGNLGSFVRPTEANSGVGAICRDAAAAQLDQQRWRAALGFTNNTVSTEQGKQPTAPTYSCWRERAESVR
jgi:hypothetical protein